MLISKRVNGKLHVNTFYLFGGRDERSQDLVQGVTLAGVLFDEVALMPESFVNQAMARCSVEGSKYWFNCNPEGPKHWFKLDHVDMAEEKGYLRIHFELDDNPSLSESIKNRYRTMFKGVFYRRFILGEWVFADGVIYDCFDDEKNCYTDATRDKVVPVQIRELDLRATYGSDYGTTNPMVYLECYIYHDVLKKDPVPFIYVEREYYYNSRKEYTQKSDEEYVQDFYEFNKGIPFTSIILDPSATSLTVAHRRKGTPIRKAKNDVLDGIRLTYTLMQMGHIMINKDQCPNLVSELGTYSWNNKAALNGKEEPIKDNDHACDALRYVVNTCISAIEVYATKPHAKGRAA
ncbi:MAG: PBSX family phage terminase large subunit [Spirochaetia bacterium]|nr:PBSX family phage terminase large subunit [Spirochaetia bacterium]